MSVNPLKLNVADVEGTLTLARATCEAPKAAATTPGASTDPTGDAGDVQAQGGHAREAGLAETGGSSMTPYLAGGAIALVLAGGGAVALARRGRS